MKRIITLAMTLVLILSLAVPAFAYGPGDEKELEVTAKYNSSTTTKPVYSADIDWDSLTFLYNETNTRTWKPSDHSYDTATDGSWEKTSANITVTNHSNAPISVTPSYTAETTYSSATMTFDKTTLTLATADNSEGDNGAGKATTDTITVTAGGTLTKDDSTSATTGTTIGQITLTIADASTQN